MIEEREKGGDERKIGWRKIMEYGEKRREDRKGKGKLVMRVKE